MQTCVGSVAGTAFTGGFGSYLIAMDQQSYENVGNIVGNNSWVRLSQVAGILKTAMPKTNWTMSTDTSLLLLHLAWQTSICRPDNLRWPLAPPCHECVVWRGPYRLMLRLLAGGVQSRAVAGHPLPALHLPNWHLHSAVLAEALRHPVQSALPLLHCLGRPHQLSAQHRQQGRC